MPFTRKSIAPGQKRTGIHMHPADPNLKAWTNAVGWAARQAYHGVPIEDPVIVGLAIFVPYFISGDPRMKMSLEKAIELKTYPINRRDGDLDKQIRGVLDAMTGIIYGDDKQVVGLYPIIDTAMQYYACADHSPGAIIEIKEV